jgi:hypothetical protein
VATPQAWCEVSTKECYQTRRSDAGRTLRSVVAPAGGRGSAPYREAVRARIVQMAAESPPSNALAGRLGSSWCKCFHHERPKGLEASTCR